MMDDLFEDIPREDIEKLIRTNLIWDLVAHEDAADLMVRLGMVMPSAEGIKVSCGDSHRRMEIVKSLEDDFAYMSAEIAKIVTAVILGEVAKDLSEEIVTQMAVQTAMLLDAGSRVIVANLIAAEILTLTNKDTNT